MPPLEIEDASGWWPEQPTYDSQGWSFASLSRTEQDHQDRLVEVDRSMEVTELSGTDTDSSSDEYEEMDYPEEITGLPVDQRGEALYWAYSQSKKRWRRFSMKPTRKVRRFKKRKGKGKGRKGKKGGRFSSHFLAEPEVQQYFKGKGKTLRRTSGKGLGESRQGEAQTVTS